MAVTDWVVRGVPELLLAPLHLHRAADVMSRQSPVPRRPGVYAWYFDEIPEDVDVVGCHEIDAPPESDFVMLAANVPRALPTSPDGAGTS